MRTATNGQSRARLLQSTRREDPVIVHPSLTQAELDQLRTFESDNRGQPFDIYHVAEGVTLTVMFKDPPWTATPFVIGGGAKRFKVQLNLIDAT